MSIFEYDKEEEERKLRKAEFEAGEQSGIQKGIQKGIQEGIQEGKNWLSKIVGRYFRMEWALKRLQNC